MTDPTLFYCYQTKDTHKLEQPNFKTTPVEIKEELSRRHTVAIEQGGDRLFKDVLEYIAHLERKCRECGFYPFRDEDTSTTGSDVSTVEPEQPVNNGRPDRNAMIFEQVEGAARVVIELLNQLEAKTPKQKTDIESCKWTFQGWVDHNLKHLKAKEAKRGTEQA